MLVFEDLRGKGIAEKIVIFLLAKSSGYQTIYCLPFEHLSNFYKKFGFREVDDDVVVPREISEKHRCATRHTNTRRSCWRAFVDYIW